MNQDWVNDWYALGPAAEVAPGRVVRKRVGSVDLALFNIGTGFFAWTDACGGCGRPLSDGRIEDNEVECAGCGLRHQIDQASDQSAPAPFPVMLVNDEIYACIKIFSDSSPS